jgi:hypothetical protein
VFLHPVAAPTLVTSARRRCCPSADQIRDRDHAIHQIETILRKLSDDPKSGVQFVEDSRWMGIFKETAFQVTAKSVTYFVQQA